MYARQTPARSPDNLELARMAINVDLACPITSSSHEVITAREYSYLITRPFFKETTKSLLTSVMYNNPNIFRVKSLCKTSLLNITNLISNLIKKIMLNLIITIFLQSQNYHSVCINRITIVTLYVKTQTLTQTFYWTKDINNETEKNRGKLYE